MPIAPHLRLRPLRFQAELDLHLFYYSTFRGPTAQNGRSLPNNLTFTKVMFNILPIADKKIRPALAGAQASFRSAERSRDRGWELDLHQLLLLSC